MSETNSENSKKSSDEEKDLMEKASVDKAKGGRSDGQLIDIKQVILLFWDNRKYFYWITAAFALLGILVSVTSPVEYQASASLLPETQSQSNNFDELRGLSTLLGINFATATNGLSPGLYPDIVQSLPFEVELMNRPIHFSSIDTLITPYQYFRYVHKPAAITYIKRYTIGLPGTILSSVFSLFAHKSHSTGNGSLIDKVTPDSVVAVTSSQIGIANTMKSRIQVLNEGSLIQVNATMPDPRAAAEVVRVGIELLKSYVKEYRTKKSMQELDYIKSEQQKAELKFKQIQAELAAYHDSNVNLATDKAQIQEKNLESEYSLRSGLYNTLTQSLEQAKLRVQRDTPVFTIVDPIQIPLSPSGPNTKLIIFYYIILGVAISFIFVVVKREWDEVKKYFTSNR